MAITVNDFNTIRTKVVNVFGQGGTGYGQALTTGNNAATSASLITVLLWNSLGADMRKARQHQTGLEVTSSELPSLSRTTQITNTVYNQFVTLANTIEANKFAIADVATVRSVELIQTSTLSGNWTAAALYHRVVIDFSNGGLYTATDARLRARYFFNAGGEVRFRASRTGTAANTKDTDWTNLLSQMGTIRFHYASTNTVPGTAAVPGTFPVGTTGFYVAPSYTTINLPTANTTTFYKTGSTYGTNRYNLTVRADSATAPYLFTFIVSFQDNAGGGIDEPVTGVTSSTIELFRPSGSQVNVPPPICTGSGATLSTTALT